MLSSQVGCLLGKDGSIIKEMSAEIGSQIRIIPRDKLPRCASSTDGVVKRVIAAEKLGRVTNPNLPPGLGGTVAHGLWPADDLGLLTRPAVADEKQKLDLTELKENEKLYDKLVMIMAGLNMDTDELLSFQWKKHGCCQNDLTQNLYFEKIRVLEDKYNFGKALKLFPQWRGPHRAEEGWTAGELSENLGRHFKFQPKVQAAYIVPSEKYLFQLLIYLNEDFSPIDSVEKLQGISDWEEKV